MFEESYSGHPFIHEENPEFLDEHECQSYENCLKRVNEGSEWDYEKLCKFFLLSDVISKQAPFEYSSGRLTEALDSQGPFILYRNCESLQTFCETHNYRPVKKYKNEKDKTPYEGYILSKTTVSIGLNDDQKKYLTTHFGFKF